VEGKPLDDRQLASLTGCAGATVRSFLRELAGANAYEVKDGEFLYFPDMVAEAEFVAAARTHGARGGKKAHRPRDESVEWLPPPLTVPAPVPARKPAAPWYKSPAGWVRMAGQHAMSIQPDEPIEAFRLRVSLRIPPGPHLEMLSPGQMKQYEAIAAAASKQ